MAGTHFIILKVNGVDVSEMPYEAAVQMFLKASEPILVEVRRRSYKTNDDSEYPNNQCYFDNSSSQISTLHEQQQPTNYIKKQSSPKAMSLMTMSHTYQQSNQEKVDPLLVTTETALPSATATTTSSPTATVDSLNFNSLVISSSNCCNSLSHRKKNPHITETTKMSTIVSRESSAGSQLNNTNSPNRSSRNEVQSNTSTGPIKAERASFTSSSPVQSKTQSPLKESTIKSGDAKNIEGNFVSIGIQTENFTTDFIFNGTTILDPEQIIENDNLFSECLAPEIDIEEITLRKSEGNERLGLTVCYSSGGGNGSGSDDTDTCTEVYISDIVPDSIAGRDGRLRQGDQILQVNGKDVTNKEETETLIAENYNAVTLLVSRYLYGDDDEYNEEQGDFYEDDDPNMEYANCFLENYIVSENVIKSSNEESQVAEECNRLLSEQQSIKRNVMPNNVFVPTASAPPVSENLITTTINSSTSRDPLNHQSIRAHLDQVNQEIAILDSRVVNMMMSQKKNTESLVQKQPTTQHQSQIESIPALAVVPMATPSLMEYDTEHIYETIPEDSESEPFYCSPYESSEHHNRIEQWLYMQNANDSTENRIRTLQHIKQHHQLSQQQQQQHHHSHSQQQYHENLSIGTKAKNGTLQSTNSSVGDDHENSSSAYNTGGSCNSNTMTPLTLELNPTNYGDRKLNHNSQSTLHNHHSQSTLILCPPKLHTASTIDENTPIITTRLPQQEQYSSSINRHSKEKPLSPSHEQAKPTVVTSQSLLVNKQRVFPFLQKSASDIAKSTSSMSATSNTMYTNVANLQQTMLLQQQLFRQALIQQQLPASNAAPCPQFTAPNLSQYHFVSSQEVSSVKLNTHSNDEHMVWKVKRRQDGTRYIVRRPARNRLLRNRAMRITAERNNDQTTEDDTISEIKTGRYWTKEERKKHIERARERRQRQQIIITNKNNEISMQPMVSSIMLTSLNSEQLLTKPSTKSADTNALQQKPSTVNSAGIAIVAAATSSGKVNRQSAQSSSITQSKKLTKKSTNNINSPTVDVNNSLLVAAHSNVSATPPIATQTTTTITTTSTTTTTANASAASGNRMKL